MANAGDKPCMNWQTANLATEWRRFRQHCDFTFKGPLAPKTEDQKVNYLMTYIGDKGREIYETFVWTPATDDTPAENATLEGVNAKYAQYVAPMKNHIRATVSFNRRKQDAGEKFDNFVTDLRILVKDCGYVEENRMLRDAIVLRASHAAVREKCLEKGDDLTLDMAIGIGQNYETSQESMRAIGIDEDPTVHAVNTGKSNAPRRSYNRPQSRFTQHGFKKKASGNKCMKCGYDRNHARCPAKDSNCNYCRKKGHFAAMCRRKASAHMVEEMCGSEESDDDGGAHLINTVTDAGKHDWWECIEVDGFHIDMQIDTGATKSLLPYKVFKDMLCDTPITKTARKFKSYTHHPIKVEGYVTLPARYKNKFVDVQYYVVHVDQKPLLSGQASEQLGLIERIHEVTNDLDKYPELRKTTGTLPGTYSIKIDPTVTPVVHGPRRQPKALSAKIRTKLKEMEADGHITKVTEPTDWVSSMVTVVRNGKLRICSDPKDLNKAIRREHYPIPTVEEVVASMPGAKVFSKIDAKSGFLQIKLDYESSLLTTFNSPIGRYRWLRLPFGIKSAPEIYQRIMDEMLEDIDGARAIMDDILIAGKTPQEHDRIMRKVVERATEWNLKLNFDKCQVKQPRVTYVGHLVTDQGLQPDPEKVRAVRSMPVPGSKEDVRRFLGFVQYLSKFIPNMSTVDAPLRDVMKRNVDFYWNKQQQRSFDELKELCCSTPVLAYYDVTKDVTIQCDASSYGLGGVLLQDGRPIAYTSRALTPTEKRYAQLEKEMLAIVHSCKKFHYYIFGKPTTVESDHKPLQAICAKPLLSAPMRLQAMLLRLQPYDLNVTYKPGKEIPMGDALSRAHLPDAVPDIEPVMINMINFIAVTPTRYKQFQECIADELNELHAMILKGWPDTKQETPHAIRM